MKAEERKALQTNALAQEVGKLVEGIKQGPSRSTMFYVGLFALVLLAIFVFRYFYRSSEATASARWMKLDEIVFPEQLSSFLSDGDLKDTPQGRLARFKEARLLLSQGLRDLGTGPEEAFKNISKGTQTYEDLIKSVGRVPLLHQEALWGAAKGYETLGELDKARTFYEQLRDKYPTSALGKDAAKQLARLDSPEGKKDLAELSRAFQPPR